MVYYGSEDYDYDRPGYAGYHRSRHSTRLDIDRSRGGGRARSHSRASSPPAPPIVNIYNDQIQDSRMRNQSPYAYPYPQPQAPAPPPPPPPMNINYYEQPHHRHRSSSSRDSRESRGRRHSRLNGDFVEGMAEMALMDRLRSRSRGRSDVALAERPEILEWRLQQKEREVEETRRRQLYEREYELNRLNEESKQMRANEAADERSKRAIQEYEEAKAKEAERRKLYERELELKRLQDESKKAREEDAAEARQKQLIKDHEEKLRKEKEKATREEKEIREKIEREEREAKEKKEAAYKAFIREEQEKKEKKEAEYKEFLREQKEREEKKKAEEKAENDKIELALRRRFENMGYSQSQIDFMVDEKKTQQYRDGNGGRSVTTITESKEIQLHKSRSPVFAKIHSDYLAVETLLYYDIPYERDPADPDYIIVLREMDKYETEVLFAHTKRLRAGQLTIEGSKEKDKQYAWFRKRDRSKSRVRQIGILEFK